MPSGSQDTAFVAFPSTNRPGEISYNGTHAVPLGWNTVFGTRYGRDDLGRVSQRSDLASSAWTDFAYNTAGMLTGAADWEDDPLNQQPECGWDPDTGEMACDDQTQTATLGTIPGTTRTRWDRVASSASGPTT